MDGTEAYLEGGAVLLLVAFVTAAIRYLKAEVKLSTEENRLLVKENMDLLRAELTAYREAERHPPVTG